ncbi:hypothetical protein [Archangium lipolyticum]|uniref:hypothetical protein n=1 Tax=Archangium lipolyticum TaxID=2970465 RepID=UPI00214A1428|nr:hypothetical protein [Archangium lipolyticum]
MPTSTPRGWFLGLALGFTSTALLYMSMSRAQAEQSWQLEQLRQEVSALHAVVSSCRTEGYSLATERRRVAGQPGRAASILSPEDVDLIAARVVSWMKRAEAPAGGVPRDEKVLSSGQR